MNDFFVSAVATIPGKPGYRISECMMRIQDDIPKWENADCFRTEATEKEGWIDPIILSVAPLASEKQAADGDGRYRIFAYTSEEKDSLTYQTSVFDYVFSHLCPTWDDLMQMKEKAMKDNNLEQMVIIAINALDDPEGGGMDGTE